MWARGATAPHRVVSQAKALLMAGDGVANSRIATALGIGRPTSVHKLTAIVGPYLNPPDQAVVLRVDEKSQIQALDRTQPGLPMKPGRCGGRKNGMTRSLVPIGVHRFCGRARNRSSACDRRQQ